LIYNVVVELGIKSDYRRVFWRAALHALRRGRIDAVLAMGFMAYHLIQFTREALRGDQNASFYATRGRSRTLAPAAEREELPPLRRSA
jgi:hopanoid C-2 methylase